MKIASWNVNSLRVRLPQVLRWLQEARPDVLALQETKLPDAEFPRDAFTELGYHAVCHGQRAYNGVALLSRRAPAEVVTRLPTLNDDQSRTLAATIDGVRILDLYVVNGQAVGSDEYDRKLDWLARVRDYVAQDLAAHPDYVILGDFNIAPDDRDVYDPAAWEERILCSTPERMALQRLLALGFRDTFRLFDQPDGVYSWWDYRNQAFARNRGLRIDLILASEPMAARCTASYVDRAPRGWQRPSDHAPVVAEFRDG